MQRRPSKALGPFDSEESVGSAGGLRSAARAASMPPASGMWDTRGAPHAVAVPKISPPPSSAPAVTSSGCSDSDSSGVEAVAFNPDFSCLTPSMTGGVPVVALPDQFQDMLRVSMSGTWGISIECTGSASLRPVTVLSGFDTRVADVDLQAQCLDDWGEFVDS